MARQAVPARAVRGRLALATMRLSATRARFSLMPKRPVRRTSWATGNSGGSMPSNALASTERAVSGTRHWRPAPECIT